LRIFATKVFGRFARSESISDESLLEAIERANAGLVDANLGGGLIKQRIGRPRQGRAGGYRTVIAFRQLDRAVFLHAFAKSERDNIDRHDLARLKKLSAIYLAASNAELESWCLRGELKKVT